MYNRYIRNDQGGYSKIPVDDGPTSGGFASGQGTPPPPIGGSPPPPQSESASPPHGTPPPNNGPFSGGGPSADGAAPLGGGAAPPPNWGDAADRTGGISGFLRRILDKFHLDGVDTGDLLLLAILFFLFKEDADDELLIALGLLLIL